MESTQHWRNIFLSDDDSDDCSLFLEALEQVQSRISVHVSRDGARLMQDLSDAGTHIPELIFLDLNMPKKSGLECLVEIRNLPGLKDIPVVVLSTTSNTEIIERSFAAGANFYITKPSNFSALKKSLAYVLSLEPGNFPHRRRDAFVINQA